MMPGKGGIWAGTPGLRPTRAITTRAPAPARGPPGRAGMVLFGGEGVPSPAPPGVIPPRSGEWDDTGKGRDLGRHPWLAPHPGHHHDIPRSCAGAPGKGRYGSLRRGGGSLPGPSPAPPRVIPPRSGAWDDAGEGRDRGRHPGALPAPAWRYLSRSGAWDDAGEGYNQDRRPASKTARDCRAITQKLRVPGKTSIRAPDYTQMIRAPLQHPIRLPTNNIL